MLAYIVRFLAVVSVTAILVACGDNPELNPIPPGGVILAFGDSLTYGTGTTRGHSYPSVLEELTGYRVINAGVSGDTTIDGLARLPLALEAHKPSLVLLGLGGNDILRRHSQAQIAENLRVMLAEIQASGAEAVLIAVPVPGVFLNAPDFYQQVADEYGVPVMMNLLPDLLADERYKSDTIHLNTEGYYLMAESIAGFLRERGAIYTPR